MYGATIGKVAIAGCELTTNQACCACTPIVIYNYYLFYFLMASKKDFIKKGEGGAQPNISREKLVTHLFPPPPTCGAAADCGEGGGGVCCVGPVGVQVTPKSSLERIFPSKTV